MVIFKILFITHAVSSVGKFRYVRDSIFFKKLKFVLAKYKLVY